MVIVILVIVLIALSIWLFMQQPRFGRLPSGGRMERIRKSPNYRNGEFQNIHHTPNLAEGVSMWTVMRKFFFGKSRLNKPPAVLPSQKTDLLDLASDKDCLVWFGHSSYFIQTDGRKILVDPVLSGAASPVSFTTRSFPGSDVYTADELPEIDYLFITHDHWDHLDYKTVVQIRNKVKRVITGLGTAEHLERWGYDKNIIIEKDWDEEVVLDQGFVVNTTSSRHFSGRGFKRNQAIWMAFVLQTPSRKIYIGGDSGYDTHFAQIGDRFGPFDLAILECGQYNEYWKYIHMMPEETVQAAIDLKAKKLFPVHWAKFSLSLSDWDEPIKRVTAEAAKKNVPIIYPMIGAAAALDHDEEYEMWWRLEG